MTKKFVNIGVHGYDVRITDKDEWFDHILEGYCVFEDYKAIPITNYFTNQPVATVHRKNWTSINGDHLSRVLKYLSEYGWVDEEAKTRLPADTKVFTHPEHWGHEITVMVSIVKNVFFVTDRHAMELNHE